MITEIFQTVGIAFVLLISIVSMIAYHAPDTSAKQTTYAATLFMVFLLGFIVRGWYGV